ncbi:MAG: AsmA family protein [Alphaproteobacteria bacterium]
MRKLIIGISVLVVVVIAAAFVGPLFVPADSIKADISREVAKATGRDLAIDGSLKFRILPAPGVSATNVRLSNAADGSAPDMLRLKAAVVEVALFPLITGNIQISRIVLSQPDVLLETYADGSNNWTFVPAPDDAPGAGGVSVGATDGETGTSQAPAVRFDNVVVDGGTLVFRTPDSTERVEKINVSLGAASLKGPFRADGTVIARGISVGVDAAVGEFVEDRATPVNLKITTGGAEIGYSGALAGTPDAARLSGQVEVRAEDLSALIAAVSDGPAPVALKGKSLEVDGTLAASQEAISIDDLALRLGDDSATGAVDVVLGDKPSAAVVLNLAQLDLDRLLAATPKSGARENGSGATSAAGGSTASKKSAPGEASSGAGFALPTGISATLEAKIDAVVYRGGVVRQVLLNTELADGSVTISQAAAQFPGGANASVIGFVSTADAAPKFEGQAELSADDFRAFLQWAGIDVATVPQDRLRKMTGSVSVNATPENVTLTDIDVSVDVSRLRGGVAIAVRERLGLGIGLSLDKFNADAYLPGPTAQAPDKSGAPTGGPAANAAADGRPKAGNAGSTGLAALDKFDAILQLKVGEVVVREQRLSGINLDATLQGGSLELRDMSVESLAGANASVSGRLDGLASAPKADVAIKLDARDGDRLLALAGVDAPAKLGATKLSGTLRGDMQNLEVDVTLDALGASMRTAGSLGVLAVPPRYDIRMDIRHPDAAGFAARIRGENGAGGPKLGALAANASLRGDLTASDIDTTIGVGPGEVSARGRLTDLASGSPRGNLAISAAHPDMVAFARLLAPGYNPAKPDLGPFAMKTDLALAENSMTLSNFAGKAGPVDFKGNAQVATGGPRPNVVASLETSEIVVDSFLPAQKGAAASNARAGGASAPGVASGRGSASGAGGQRWSREPIELSGLRAADADIKLSAPAITYTNIRVDQPRFSIKLDDGVLDLTELSGKAFGGGFNMTGQVAAGDVPTMRYAMRVENADAAKFLGEGEGAGGERGVMSVLDLLFPVSDVKLASGRLGADLDVTSRGRSEFEMISNLAGKGAMRFTDAVVEGIDVCQISNQLDRLNGIEGFLGLASSGRGGQTKIANFDGRFDLANGIATLPQQQINADCAAVAFSGTTNLPAWTVDIRARAGFPAHPEFAGVVVEQKGPLDAPNTRLVNVNEINQFIVGKAAGSILRKLLPGGNQEQAPPAADGNTTQQPAPSKPEDQFKNLLEGLIRGR